MTPPSVRSGVPSGQTMSAGEAAAVGDELQALLQQDGATAALAALEAAAAAAAAGPPPDLDAPRGAYQQLQSAALRSVGDLAVLQRRVAQLVERAVQARVLQEAMGQGLTDPAGWWMDRLREDRDRARLQVRLRLAELAVAAMGAGGRAGTIRCAGRPRRRPASPPTRGMQRRGRPMRWQAAWRTSAASWQRPRRSGASSWRHTSGRLVARSPCCTGTWGMVRGWQCQGPTGPALQPAASPAECICNAPSLPAASCRGRAPKRRRRTRRWQAWAPGCRRRVAWLGDAQGRLPRCSASV